MASHKPVGDEAIGMKVLPDVSRSFSITLRALPRSVRGPISLAYLLARATDTLADTTGVPVAERLTALELLAQSIAAAQAHPSLDAALQDFAAVQKDTGERRLIEGCASLLRWLAALPGDDRGDIQEVLGHITHGQALDLERFSGAQSIEVLASAGALDEYTYLVAGCVGEFWTRVCGRHLARYSTMDKEALEACGVKFGKGLQLVNILRDLPEDLRAGRCYLPEGAPGGDRSQLDRLVTDASSLEPAIQQWSQHARGLLDAGWRYTLSLRSLRMRFACAIPVLLGLKTLQLVEQQPAVVGVKVSRAQVRRLVAGVTVRLVSNVALERMKQRICGDRPG